ncbi:hypothetical protein PN499_07000 [Kamptonema animale CS-326]|jgi:hypothetical protein|uniref:hypothetical protein n=1 Tax=Kamptonema animale TaxID=92934 RepID=UPI00232B7A62|nr:hypothetical protein [Kamptonema animale]MDB9510924.1 hypothetical protein [Kamptonema animale CS-326]
MSCHHDILGKPICYILEHPERPQEIFCITCKRQFIEQESKEPKSNAGIWLLIAVVVIVLLLLLTACEKPTTSLFIPTVKSGNSTWIDTE